MSEFDPATQLASLPPDLTSTIRERTGIDLDTDAARRLVSMARFGPTAAGDTLELELRLAVDDAAARAECAALLRGFADQLELGT